LRGELGLQVPQQVSVAGFDDVPQASALAYGLTSYAQPLVAMVQELVQLLMTEIAQRKEAQASPTSTAIARKNRGQATLVPGQLMVRTSTRPVP
jgi:DNA-binding LacI/PurR family transcriptional regulator